ncbi:MAG: hypothetical protein LBF32_05120 [Streptococcaceae bacterium]|jgi:hypothetical protein|nr:hypothetical protein [Streptococcaceae bacterium]
MDDDTLKTWALSMAIGLNDSTTYVRGQGSLTLMLLRILCNIAGRRVTLVGKWHAKSSFYPLPIDALLFNYYTPGFAEDDPEINFIIDIIRRSIYYPRGLIKVIC